MRTSIEDIDKLIARKRQELKDLIQEEIDELMSVRDGIRYSIGDLAVPSTKAKVKESPLCSTKAPASPPPVTNRLDAIAAAAERRSSSKSGLRYSIEKKFEILDEYEAAPVKATVLAKHGVSAQSVGKWRTDMRAGRLARPA